MDTKGQLINSSFYGVDNAPANPLGTLVFTGAGVAAKYVKATAQLTAGTAVGAKAIVPATLTAPEDGVIKVGSATPAISTLQDGDLDGTMYKVTHAGEAKVLAASGSRKVDNAFYLSVQGVKKGDTIAFAEIGGVALAGGSTVPGTLQAVSFAKIPSGKYGWVVVGRTPGA